MSNRQSAIALSAVPTSTGGLEFRRARVLNADDPVRPYPSLPASLDRRLRQRFTGDGHASLDYAVGFLNGVACYLGKPRHPPLLKLLTLGRFSAANDDERKNTEAEEDVALLLRLVRRGLEGTTNEKLLPTRLLPPTTNRLRCGDFARGFLGAFMDDPVWSASEEAAEFLAPLRHLVRQAEQACLQESTSGGAKATGELPRIKGRKVARRREARARRAAQDPSSSRASSAPLDTYEARQLAPLISSVYWEHRLHGRPATSGKLSAA